MAFIHYLRIDGTELPLPISYDLSLSDVTADSSGETEAGTTQRDVVRSGVATISVSFQVSPVWLKKLSTMRKQPKLSVDFFNTAGRSRYQVNLFVCYQCGRVFDRARYCTILQLHSFNYLFSM